MTANTESRFQLVTQSSFDGLTCAMLLREVGLVEEVSFIHPNDMKNGKATITGQNITAGLPYDEAVHLAFDHHISEAERFEHSPDRWNGKRTNHVLDTAAPSSARVIYRYYGGRQKVPDISEDMLQAVDRSDSGNYRRADILAPRGWTMLNFLLDQRTGLAQFQDFRTSHRDFLLGMISYCRNHTIEDILSHPDVKERMELYWDHHYNFIDQLERCSHQDGNVVILDLRNQQPIYVGNRFMIYALYPAATVSIQITRTADEKSTVFAVRKSNLNRKSFAHIGSIMLEHGGGGHDTAGTCQIDSDHVMSALEKVVKRINAAG